MNSDGTILLVEDNTDDIFFMQRAIKSAGIQNPVQVAQDGQEALDYIESNGKFADRDQYPCPCIVLLDLKLPHKTGHEVLASLRQRPEFVEVIVIALTTSREPRDIQEAYRLGVNAYLVKPSSPAELTQMMIAFREFWLRYNVVE